MNLLESILRIKQVMGINEQNSGVTTTVTPEPANKSLYKVYHKSVYNISYPKSATTENALFVFGGVTIGGKDFVYNKVPKDIKENRIVITCEYDETLEGVLSKIKSDFSGNTNTPTDFKIKSICGYSGGGPNTLKQLGKGYFIGLMDAYIDEMGLMNLKSEIGKSQPFDKIKMLYSFNEWEKYKEIKSPKNPYWNIVEAAKILRDSAKELVGESHSGFPVEFFARYHDLI